MQNRPKSKAIAMYELLTNGIANRKKFDGRWVNTIVDIAPILSTSLEDKMPLNPLTKLQQNSKVPTVAKIMSYRS